MGGKSGGAEWEFETYLVKFETYSVLRDYETKKTTGAPAPAAPASLAPMLISIYIKNYLNYLWLSWMVLMTNKCKWFATRALFEFYLTFMNCFQFSCDFSIQNCFDIFSQIISLSYGLTTRVTFKIFVTFVFCFNL